MNFTRTVVYILVFFIIVPNLSAQMKQDVGIRYELGQLKMAILEYRLPIAKRTNLTMAVACGGRNPLYDPWQQFAVLSANDTLVENRYSSKKRFGADVRIALSRQLRWPVFSVQTALAVGYRTTQDSRISDYVKLVDGFWTHTFTTSAPLPYNYASLKTHKLVPAGLLSVRMDLPLGQRFSVTSSVTACLQGYVVVHRDEISDPLNEFNWSSALFWRMDNEIRVSAGLRYHFGRIKEYPSKNKNPSQSSDQ